MQHWRAAACRVALIDKGDFASGASSSSSNLAWGGIKYLESQEYLLVNKLCQIAQRVDAGLPLYREGNPLLHHHPAAAFASGPFFVFLGSSPVLGDGALCHAALHARSATRAKDLEASLSPWSIPANAAGGLEYSDCYLYDNDARFVFNFIRTSAELRRYRGQLRGVH